MGLSGRRIKEGDTDIRVYSDSLSRCIRMALQVVLLLFTVLAIDPPGLNSPFGISAPVSAQGGAGWGGTWRASWQNGGSDLTITQSGNQVTGDVTFQYGALAQQYKLTGTVAGNEFEGKLTIADRTMTDWVLTLAPDGQSITLTRQSGVYTFTRAGTGTGTTTSAGTGTGTGNTSDTGAGIKGDYNGDGKVTELDALAALRMSVGSLPMNINLDMDGDGKVTAKDALAILKMAVGK